MYWEKLSGTSYRQDVIDVLHGDEEIRLVAEPDNQYDPYAVRVEADGNLVGYIPKGRNKEISDIIMSGDQVTIDDWNITGGVDGKLYGINVHIILPVPTQLKHMKQITPIITNVPGAVYFDERNHRYYTADGQNLLSGSVFESSQVGEPTLDYAAKALAKSTGIDSKTIQGWWELHGELSRDFGTMVHKALQFFTDETDNLMEYSKAREVSFNFTDFVPATVGQIVEEYNKFSDKFWKNSESEVFVRAGLLCGFIDRLYHYDDGSVDIIDYKITKGIKKVKTEDYGSLDKYTLQQNFYRTILKANRISVRGMYLHVYDGESWSEKKLKKINLSKSLDDYLEQS